MPSCHNLTWSEIVRRLTSGMPYPIGLASSSCGRNVHNREKPSTSTCKWYGIYMQCMAHCRAHVHSKDVRSGPTMWSACTRFEDQSKKACIVEVCLVVTLQGRAVCLSCAAAILCFLARTIQCSNTPCISHAVRDHC